ncbi:aminotransferase class V-fold PLP-dependent enzyme [Geobacter sp. SVR]|uniref:aminotransferase class V-fold PLP-dependent enzyme n=1 Tax=Geobacter sp. SVR TaxID=2495594 RepID=UPI00143F02D8|nr:aminotransferase class V-fold PLP-dependent enzyme [Geobacter sp. SVR]BCS54323.1 cysteine desulfurase [Geobacter sp. SVR]GCF85818.1 cysteine desulfurase [Geobacter sp. SVR]
MSLYLDNAATSFPKPESVYQAVMQTMREVGASAGRGGHRRSLEAGRLLFRAREAVARLLSARDSSRVIFTHSATEALNLALRGTLAAGDHVVTTAMEHNSLLRPLYLLRGQGVELTIVNAGSDGLVDPADVRRAVRPNTRLVAVGHVSNVSGTIQPVEEMITVARKAGALFLLDAAQSAGSLPIDVSGSGIDLLAAPGHKGLLGPQGTGFLYVAPRVALRPFMAGGTGGHSTLEEQPAAIPEGFEVGTHNMPGIAGLAAGIDFVLDQGVSVVGGKERSLAESARQGLGNIPGLTICGPPDPLLRGGVLSFTVAGFDSAALAFALDQRFDIAVRAGLHCAPLAHRALGTFPGGTVRLSPGWFSTTAEIAFFCDAVVECIRTAGQ